MLPIKEGDLYRVVDIDGVRFKIHYGYISENEKERGWEPYPVYPDFIQNPQHTVEGEPFVTAFQDVCKHYKPTASGEVWCHNCEWLDKRDTHIGICKCPHNRVKKNE